MSTRRSKSPGAAATANEAVEAMTMGRDHEGGGRSVVHVRLLARARPSDRQQLRDETAK